MKIKVSKLISSIDSLRHVSELSLNAKVAFRLSRAINIIQNELKVIEDTRLGILKKYGSETEGQFKINEDKMEEFKNEINAFLNEEIDLNIQTISINEMGALVLSVNHMANIDFLFTD